MRMRLFGISALCALVLAIGLLARFRSDLEESVKSAPPRPRPHGSPVSASATESTNPVQKLDPLTKEQMEQHFLQSQRRELTSQDRARIEALKLEGKRIAEQVSRETIRESVGALRLVDPLNVHLSMDEQFPPSASWELQSMWLRNHRVARLIIQSRTGTQAERDEIVAAIIDEVNQFVDARMRSISDKPLSDGELEFTTGDSYALILAEADRTGESLPTLLAWFDEEQATANASLQSEIERGTVTPEQAQGGAATGTMPYIGAAAGTILLRIDVHAFDGMESLANSVMFQRQLFHDRGDFDQPDVSSLQSYPLLSDISTRDAQQVMDIVERYLARE